MFRARSTSTAGTRSLLNCEIRSTRCVPPFDGVEGAGIHSPILVHHEVGIGCHEQRRRSSRSGCRIAGNSETCRAASGSKKTSVKLTILPQAGTAVEEVHAGGGHDALVDIRAAAVVPDIIGTNHERRNPEDLGPRELRFGHPHTGLRGGHDQRPGVGKTQGGGEVDRKAKVVRLQRRAAFSCTAIGSRGAGGGTRGLVDGGKGCGMLLALGSRRDRRLVIPPPAAKADAHVVASPTSRPARAAAGAGVSPTLPPSKGPAGPGASSSSRSFVGPGAMSTAVGLTTGRGRATARSKRA